MRLDDPDLILILRFWLGLAAADVRLRLFPSSWKRKWIFDSPGSLPAETSNPGTRPLPPDREISRLEVLIAKAACRPLFFDMSCLRRALVLRDYLRRTWDFEAKVVFGTRKVGPKGAAVFHAWLETRRGDGSNSVFSKFS